MVRFNNNESASRYTWFLLFPSNLAIFYAASILLISIYAGFSLIALPNASAAIASPLALIIVDFLSSKAYYTWYLALSAYYYAIYFSSIAFVNSYPNTKSTIETSSKMIANSLSLLVKPSLIWFETYSL